MKSLNAHTSTVKALQYIPRFPQRPKVVLFGAPNVGNSTFAKRLAIDLGVPAVSLNNIYKSLLRHEDFYRSETFYRRVIGLLKSSDVEGSQATLVEEKIPEKLLTLTKHTELGFVLYDYPSTVKQAEK